MNTNWQSFLTTLGARFNAENNEVTDFGQPAKESKAGSAGTVLVPLTHLGVIACRGEDAGTFLHNQLSSDLKHLGAKEVQHSAWCTAQGRMVASFLIWRQEESYQLVLAENLAAPIVPRFKKYVLRSKVVFENLGDSRVLLGLAGPEASSALVMAGLPVPAEPLTQDHADGVTIVRLDPCRFMLSLDVVEAVQKWPPLAGKALPSGVSVWHWLDINAALPWISAATCEEFVPQMVDFDQLGGVSFHKGCYPGQEIIARSRYLGKVKRHLFRVTSPVPLQAGDNLHSPEHPDQAIGKIISAAPAPAGGYVALAALLSSYAQSAHLGCEEGPLVQTEAVHPCA